MRLCLHVSMYLVRHVTPCEHCHMWVLGYCGEWMVPWAKEEEAVARSLPADLNVSQIIWRSSQVYEFHRTPPHDHLLGSSHSIIL